jgi:hypothetical protein
LWVIQEAGGEIERVSNLRSGDMDMAAQDWVGGKGGDAKVLPGGDANRLSGIAARR